MAPRSAPTIADACSVMGMAARWRTGPATMSVLLQLSVRRFSFCLTPFADRKPSHLFLGARTELQRHKEIQTTRILKSPEQHPPLFCYVPLVGLSLGGRRLAVPATSLELKPNGFGGTIVDSGSTIMLLVEPAFKALKKAVLGTVKLPVAN